MNRILRIDEEKPEMHITVQDYKVTLCFAEKENPEVAVLVKQALLSAYAMPQKYNDLLKVLHSEDLMKGWSVKWLKESIAYTEVRIRKAFSCRRTPATILQRKKAGTLLARSRRSACPAIKSALMTLLS